MAKVEPSEAVSKGYEGVAKAIGALGARTSEGVALSVWVDSEQPPLAEARCPHEWGLGSGLSDAFRVCHSMNPEGEAGRRDTRNASDHLEPSPHLWGQRAPASGGCSESTQTLNATPSSVRAHGTPSPQLSGASSRPGRKHQLPGGLNRSP